MVCSPLWSLFFSWFSQPPNLVCAQSFTAMRTYMDRLVTFFFYLNCANAPTLFHPYLSLCVSFFSHLSLGPSLLLFSILPLPHVSKCSPSKKKTTLFFSLRRPDTPCPLFPPLPFFSMPFVQLSFLDGMDAEIPSNPWSNSPYHTSLLHPFPFSCILYLLLYSMPGMIGILLDPIEPIWV